jgi:NADH-quinone oxidoreductase subunit L
MLLALVPLLPFAGFLANAGLGRRLAKSASGAIACSAMIGAFAASAVPLWRLVTAAPDSRAIVVPVFTWLTSGNLSVPLTLRLDPLSALMVFVVTAVGSLIHVYSTAYMHEETDSEYARYFSYLNLFAAFMLLLVLASNFLVMFVGWEGVGLCSYLLIGFWYEKKSAADAGKKAFVVNRIGDAGFILGILLAFVHFGTLDFQEIAGSAGALAPETHVGPVSAITLLLLLGATGKSAQIPLYVWLPDAMEGPTPVSALIHAATMVTAGVYMIGRNAVLFSHAPLTLGLIAVIGAATAIMAATIGLVQNDIKRVLAYSTVSQLGYMFLAMGVGAYAAGIFHLFTHAFFKALLFLGSGAVIHALAGEQDLRRMGGLKNQLPVTYWTFLIGALAITGIPPLSGFVSKDEILYRTFASGRCVLWAVGLVTSLLTAVYMFRIVFLAFHGSRRVRESPARAHPDEQAAAVQAAVQAAHGGPARLHDAPPAMAVALVALAIGSAVAGFAGWPVALGGADRLERFLRPALLVEGPEALGAPGPELALMLVSIAVAISGIALAYFYYVKDRERAQALGDRFAVLRRVLVHKYYVDEIYDAAVVRPTRIIAEEGLWKDLDVGVIDRAVNGVGESVTEMSRLLRRLQSGSVRAYAASLFLGVVLVVGYYLWR